MNAPLNSDSQLYTAPDTGRSAAPSSYSPSVPISVYRELSTELKTAQSTLDALTQQNQQLLRQNHLLRTEIQRFVQSAEQLGHFAGIVPADTHTAPRDASSAERPMDASASPSELFTPPLTAAAFVQQPTTAGSELPAPAPSRTAASQPSAPEAPARGRERPVQTKKMNSAIVPHPKSKKRDRGRPTPEADKYRLFTEQPDEGRPLSKVASRSDLGNLWLATTILLVVVSAFGAGFLIMRPLLNNR